MAIWEVRVVYRTGDRFWENTYHVDVGSATDVPAGVISAFIDFARNALLEIYTVERVVRRPAGTTDAFIETIVGAAGLLEIGSNKALPLWNTVRVLLNAGAGRPGVKFLRGILTQASLIDEQNHIDGGSVSLIQGLFDALTNELSDESCWLVEGEDNKQVVSGIVQSTIQMRQQHRKRKKTT
jgi:hypothetical protein